MLKNTADVYRPTPSPTGCPSGGKLHSNVKRNASMTAYCAYLIIYIELWIYAYDTYVSAPILQDLYIQSQDKS